VTTTTTEQTTDQPVEQVEPPAVDRGPEPNLVLELELSQAEALRTWLLKPAKDGTTALDDPLVSRVLAMLGRAVDSTLATVNIRRELQEAGMAVDHLSDDQVREIGRASPTPPCPASAAEPSDNRHHEARSVPAAVLAMPGWALR
jgi:hypothetical protein